MHNINDKRARFGSAGNGQKFYEKGYKSTPDICEWLHKNGLSAYEYQATRGVRLSGQGLDELAAKARQFDIALSIHAPYYITMGNPDEKLSNKSIGYIMDCLKAAKRINAGKVVLHLGGACKQERKLAIDHAKRLMEKVLIKAENEVLLEDTFLCPETMGKPGQLGTLDEVLDICTMHRSLRPTLDLAHLHAISQGGMKDKAAFDSVFEKLDNVLGSEASTYPHIHFSPIEYGKSGELRHRCLREKEFGPDFSHLAASIIDLKIYPTIICESAGTQVEDASSFREIYQMMKDGK